MYVYYFISLLVVRQLCSLHSHINVFYTGPDLYPLDDPRFPWSSCRSRSLGRKPVPKRLYEEVFFDDDDEWIVHTALDPYMEISVPINWRLFGETLCASQRRNGRWGNFVSTTHHHLWQKKMFHSKIIMTTNCYVTTLKPVKEKPTTIGWKYDF